MEDQRLERIANELSSLNDRWQLMGDRLAKRMEEMMAVLSIQSQQSRAEDPSHHTSSSQVISISPSPLENLPEKQTTKETPPSPSPLANPPEQQLTKTTAPPKINPLVHPLPKPTTPPQITSAEPSPPKTPKKLHLLAKTESLASPSPPKIPPSSTINKPLHHPQYQPPKSHSPATLFPISSTHHSPYLKITHGQPQTKRTKPKKPPSSLKPNLFHTDWSRKRKRARFKSRNFMERRKPLAVSKFGVNGSSRGKKDTGLGKRGPKKKRQVRRANIRGFKFKVSAIRSSARKRLGKKTWPWLRVAGIGQRQGAGLGRMGSDPEGPTESGSPPDGISGHRRPPSRSPDGDYAKGGDFGVNHGSPKLSIEHRGEPPCDSVMDAEIPADDRQFPVSEVDRGGHSGSVAGGKLR